MVNHFWQSVDAILEDFLLLKQLFDAKLLIQRLSSFSVPKITIVRHVLSQVKVAPHMGKPISLNEKRP